MFMIIMVQTNQRRLDHEFLYIRSRDYFILDLKLSEKTRSIGKQVRMHRDYLKEYHSTQFSPEISEHTLPI